MASDGLSVRKGTRSGVGLEDAIACAKERNGALEACLGAFVTYNPDGSFFFPVFSIRGRGLDRIAQPMVAILVVAVGACLLEHSLEEMGDTSVGRDGLSEYIFAMHQFVGTAMAFLLVYRLGRSAVRYYEARAKAGAMIALVRKIAQCAMGYLGDSEYHRDRVVRFAMALPVATLYLLRKNKVDRGDWGNRTHLAGVLTDEEFQLMMEREHQPLWVQEVMRESVVKVLGTAGKFNTKFTDAARAAMLRETMDVINQLGDAFGGMERIDGTPLPFAYLAHLRTFLLLYLLTLPVAGAIVWGWWAIPISLVCGYVFLGIEAAAADCERPFAPSPNHLMLERFCIVSFANIIQTWQGIVLPDMSVDEQEAARQATEFEIDDFRQVISREGSLHFSRTHSLQGGTSRGGTPRAPRFVDLAAAG